MRKGKMIAQGAHASMKVFFNRFVVDNSNSCDTENKKVTLSLNKEMQKWVFGIFEKIVVYVNSEDELLEIYKKAKENDIICALIEDSGLTEFHGQKTYTAVAIGPAYEDKIDKITGHLPLQNKRKESPRIYAWRWI